jgi:hypothetical protein
MRLPIRSAAVSGLAVALALACALPALAQERSFPAGGRVEGRIGSNWEQCTQIGERRPTGGYLLRCESHPNQESVFAASDVRALQGPDRGGARERPVAAPAVVVPVAPMQSAAEFRAIPPHPGVYGCMNQDAFEMTSLQIGVIDASTYSTFDGGRGRYRYSTATGIMSFTSGPLVGVRYVRSSERAFLMLDEHGARTAFNCPWSPKDPQKLHW